MNRRYIYDKDINKDKSLFFKKPNKIDNTRQITEQEGGRWKKREIKRKEQK